MLRKREKIKISLFLISAPFTAQADANNDGKLVKEEVKAFLKTTLGDDWAVEEFDMIFNALDLGDKGFLETADLFNFMVEKN